MLALYDDFDTARTLSQGDARRDFARRSTGRGPKAAAWWRTPGLARIGGCVAAAHTDVRQHITGDHPEAAQPFDAAGMRAFPALPRFRRCAVPLAHPSAPATLEHA